MSKRLLCTALFLSLSATGLSYSNYCQESPFFFSAELLYLKATEDNLEYADAFEVTPPTTLPPRILVNARPLEIDFTWAPGARLSAGYIASCFDVGLTWTYYHSSSKSSTSTINDSNRFLKPTWFPFLLGGVADSASSNWTLNFNTLDLQFGKEFSIGSSFFLHPYAALRGAWIDQKYRIDYHAGYQFVDGGVSDTLFADTSFNAQNDFKAIGPRFGVDGSLQVSSCWSLIGEVASSLLYGQFDIEEVVNGNLLADIGGGVPTLLPEILTLSEKYNRPRFNLEGLLGLQYNKYLNFCNGFLAASLFYEVDIWINQNVIIDRSISVNSAPITATATNANINENIEHQQGSLQLSGFGLRLHFNKTF